MKIKANKILAVLCVIAMVMTMIVPMTMTATAAETKLVATFTMGADGSAAHADGSTNTSYTEPLADNSYTLNITDGVQLCTGARDAMGNGTIRIGSSKNVGSFQFTVPQDIVKVIVYVAQYKANTTQITVNEGAGIAISTASNNGAYTPVEVDTSSDKTVKIATTSSGKRCMINTIEFYAADDSGCEHVWGDGEITTEPGCTTPGVRTYTCSECGDTKTTAIDALDHTWDEGVENPAATCTVAGTMTYTCTRDNCGETKNETIAAPGHNYVDGTCDVCGEAEPEAGSTVEATITFDDTSKRTVGTTSQQVWVENGITVTNNKGSSTSNVNTSYYNPIRLYKSSELIVAAPGNISTIVFNCSSASYASALQASITGSTVDGTVVTVTLNGTSNSFNATMGNQTRVSSIVVTYTAGDSNCQHPNTEEILAVEPTCSKVGYTAGTKCSECGAIITEPEEIPATGIHEYVDGVCAVCGDIEDNVGDKLTIAQALAAGSKMGHDTYTEDKYYVTGVIAEVYNTTYGNMRIKDENGNILTIYGTYIDEGATRYDAMAYKPQAGDTVTIYGVVGQYNGTAQIKNGWITEIGNIDALDAVNAYMTLAYKYAEDGGQLVDSMFVLKCGVDATLADIEGITSYGIRVTANGKTVDYTSLTVGDDGKIYVAINLGDIINVDAKLSTAFTVCAFVEANGVKVVSTSTKTYSVAGMVDAYHTQDIVEVEHLYNVLNERGLV